MLLNGMIQQRTLSNLYFLHNCSENVEECVADQEEKESTEAEDPFEVNCTKQFPTKNLRNTNTVEPHETVSQ